MVNITDKQKLTGTEKLMVNITDTLKLNGTEKRMVNITDKQKLTDLCHTYPVKNCMK